MPAKKTPKKEKSNIKDIVMSVISSRLVSVIKDNLREFMDEVQERIYHAEKVILQKLFATIILSLGAVFVILSSVFYLKEYQQWTSTQSFLVVGLILIVVSFAMKYFIMKNEFKR